MESKSNNTKAIGITRRLAKDSGRQPPKQQGTPVPPPKRNSSNGSGNK